ncbi:UDP-glucose 6-dehydrogenase YwqF [compost metagenome]
MNAGIGFGGACFPKDTLGLINIAEQVGHDFTIMKEVVEVNRRQYLKVIEKLQSVYSKLNGRTVSILGLSFKPNTNDLREAPSIKIINELYKITDGNIKIRVYDPISMEEAREQLPTTVEYCDSVENAVTDSDAAIIVTEWKDIVEKNWDELSKLMNVALIIDGRNSIKQPLNNKDIIYLPLGKRNYSNETKQFV